MTLYSKGTLQEWIFQKYLDWQKAQGEPASQAQFAAFLGVEPAYVSLILHGKKKRLSMETAYRFGSRLGDMSVLDVCGYPVGDGALEKFPPAERGFVLAVLERIAKAKIDFSAPDWKAKVMDVLSEFGARESDR